MDSYNRLQLLRRDKIKAYAMGSDSKSYGVGSDSIYNIYYIFFLLLLLMVYIF